VIAMQARPIVLVVEDEPILRMTAADMVEAAGLTALEAKDADDAIRILETRADIRIVFTDIDMSRGFDGLRLAALIRDRWPRIEIILTSGKGRPEQHRMPARGVFFGKPFREEEIVAEMHRMAAHRDGPHP
jgi:CheY-like chemotaxis protein